MSETSWNRFYFDENLSVLRCTKVNRWSELKWNSISIFLDKLLVHMVIINNLSTIIETIELKPNISTNVVRYWNSIKCE